MQIPIAELQVYCTVWGLRIVFQVSIAHGTTAEYQAEGTHPNLYVISRVKLGNRQMLTPILDVVPRVSWLTSRPLVRVIVIHERFAVDHVGAVLLLPDAVYIPCPYKGRDMEPKDRPEARILAVGASRMGKSAVVRRACSSVLRMPSNAARRWLLQNLETLTSFPSVSL